MLHAGLSENRLSSHKLGVYPFSHPNNMNVADDVSPYIPKFIIQYWLYFGLNPSFLNTLLFVPSGKAPAIPAVDQENPRNLIRWKTNSWFLPCFSFLLAGHHSRDFRFTSFHSHGHGQTMAKTWNLGSYLTMAGWFLPTNHGTFLIFLACLTSKADSN